MENFGAIYNWEKVVESYLYDNKLEGLRVELDLGDWPARVAMRAFAYAMIATGRADFGDQILRLVGKEG